MSGAQTLKHFNKTGFRPVFWTSESMQKRRNNLVEVKFVWQIQDPLQMAQIQTAILSKNDFLSQKGGKQADKNSSGSQTCESFLK